MNGIAARAPAFNISLRLQVGQVLLFNFIGLPPCKFETFFVYALTICDGEKFTGRLDVGGEDGD
jgi:hypothetical protein